MVLLTIINKVCPLNHFIKNTEKSQKNIVREVTTQFITDSAFFTS